MQRNFNESEIFNSATPAQKILWNFISLRFGQKIAVSQFYFCGVDAALNELNIFNARRIFVCYQYNGNFEHNTASNSVWRNVYVYNETNVLIYEMTNGSAIYNTTIPSAQTFQTWLFQENFYFGRIACSMLGSMYHKFIGFRVTY